NFISITNQFVHHGLGNATDEASASSVISVRAIISILHRCDTELRSCAMSCRIPRRLFFGGLVAAWAAAPRAVPAAQPAGAVETARGECYALAAAARRDLAPASEVFVGDAVGTGPQSALALQLGTATPVKLGAEAR